MSRWQNVQDRAGWTTTEHSSRIRIVWFFVLVIIATIIGDVIKVDLSWVYFVAIAIGSRFIAQLIVGPEKKDEEESNDG